MNRVIHTSSRPERKAPWELAAEHEEACYDCVWHTSPSVDTYPFLGAQVKSMSVLSLLKAGIGMLVRRPRMLAVGTTAPDFAVTAHNGSTVQLSKLRGKKVVLWFYPKASTSG